MEQLKEIIIIDDDDRNIFALSAVLKAKGFHCVSAVSGKEALEKLMQNTIGLALIDMMMPEMDGYELIKKIRLIENYKSIPLIAVTAQAMLGDKEKCLQAGADGYISKPISIDILLQILQQHMPAGKIYYDRK
ncbi:MAG: response regulator [Ferruginibacter sp.]|nr:response regulator [Ferruginibacter sp.]